MLSFVVSFLSSYWPRLRSYFGALVIVRIINKVAFNPHLHMRTGDNNYVEIIGILKVVVSFILSYLAWYLQQYLQQVGGCCIFRGDIMAAAQNQLRANRRVRRRLCVDRKHHR